VDPRRGCPRAMYWWGPMMVVGDTMGSSHWSYYDREDPDGGYSSWGSTTYRG
jgi:hypothetical protein